MEDPTPGATIPRRRPPRMTPRPQPPPPIAEASPARPAERPSWQRYTDALCVLIPREPDEFEQYLMRVSLLKARYTPWKSNPTKEPTDV